MGATFGGNFLATTAANAVLDIVAEPNFLNQVKIQSNFLRSGLQELTNKFSNIINNLQGRGLLLGLKTNIVEKLIFACREQKLLTLGADNNVMRLIPALNINQNESSLALKKLEAALISLNS